MRDLTTLELTAVSGAANEPSGQAPNKFNPAKAPGESYKGSADKNFGPQ